jgi:hypothetical protein
MRKFITVLAISISLTASAQKKDSTLTDSTKFLSIKDISRISEKYQDLATFKEYQSFLTILNAVIKEAVAEWNDKNKIKK